MASPLDLFTLVNNTSLGATADPNDAQSRQALQQVQAYDPNAYYRPIYGSDSQLLGYQLTYDASKLPGPSGGSLASQNTGDFMPSFSTVQPNMQLGDPNAVQSGTPYGTITANTNIQQPSSLLDVLGPAAVLGFGLMMGGMPAIYQGVFGQGQYGGIDLSGLGANDPFLQGGTGAMDMTGSAGTGIPGSFGADAPLGSAESSLFGPGVLQNPETALGGAAFPPESTYGMFDRGLGTADGGTLDVNTLPVPSSGFSLSDFLKPIGQLANGLSKIPGLGGGSGNVGLLGGGGGGGFIAPMGPYKSLTEILRNYGLLGGPHG